MVSSAFHVGYMPNSPTCRTFRGWENLSGAVARNKYTWIGCASNQPNTTQSCSSDLADTNLLKCGISVMVQGPPATSHLRSCIVLKRRLPTINDEQLRWHLCLFCTAEVHTLQSTASGHPPVALSSLLSQLRTRHQRPWNGNGMGSRHWQRSLHHGWTIG